MIELKLTFLTSLYEDYLLINQVIAWVLDEIKRRYQEKITSESGSVFSSFNEDYDNDRFIQGVVIVYEKDKKRMNGLIVCEDKEFGNEILKLLQQPPEPFKGKYVACIASEEPLPVNEQPSIKIEEVPEEKETSIKIDVT